MSIRRSLIASALSLGFALPLAGQSLEDVLANHHEAIGGVEAWQAVESMRSEGYLSLMGGMAEGSILVVAKRPGSLRADLVVQGMEVIQAFDGENGWMVNPFAGSTTPQPADATTLAAMTEQADMDGPLVGTEEGQSLALLGTETIDDTEA
ncbi:MAG: hypothetical protein OEU54_03480, partial [Gemmatimonadota bacterium]|nr:hypothetical protein [Gemmatimonadota bacterium]